MANKHRIFVALPISARLKEQVFAWARAYHSLPVRWLEGKNLHITLIPPWYEENVGEVCEKLQTLAWGRGSLAFIFQRIEYGPNPRSPRLIWAAGPTPSTLFDLKKQLEQCLGVLPEKRSLKLHLTLARFRPDNFSQFSLKHLDERVIWDEIIPEVVLMESHLARGGANYEVLTRLPLV